MHTGNISVDSSLNVKGQNKHYNWLLNPGEELIEIIHDKEIITCPAKEIVKRLNKILKPFNNRKLNVSTYCINVADIKSLPGSKIILS